MDDNPLIAAKTPPALSIPQSSATVDVRVIDTETLVHLNPKLFWQPEIAGFNGHHAPSYCFLISHASAHIVFDLGTRPDWQNCAPKLRALVESTTTVTPGSDAASMLDNGISGLNIRSADVKAVIWSHNHFDHIGDITTFPPSTELVVGPGVRALSWPGWPLNPDAIVLDEDQKGRHVREIAFDHGLKVGRFDAHDYFGDGSFYLLDAPGHAMGHLCGIARTTADPPTFVFMGADACHHVGVLRPSEYIPLPRVIRIPTTTKGSPAGIKEYPGHLCQRLTLGQSPTNPFFKVAQSALFPDFHAAMETVRKIQELDADENIFVLMAHDVSLKGEIPMFPATINSWRRRDLKTATRWLFCKDFEVASAELGAQS
ncbi:MAG: hypothetical protein Q9219_006846 [cf. Caloplaca sp. 3 TL-2023]